MKAETAVIDNQISPRARDQVPFADDFRRAFHEHDEDFESPTTDLEHVAVPLEQALRCPQAKGPKDVTLDGDAWCMPDGPASA